MMEPQNLQHIIAATATKRLELAGGSTMEQALPEDYVLANFVLRALEERNGQELEFVLKSYLRIHMVPLKSESTCFLVEPLGFTSGQFRLLTQSALYSNLEQIKNLKSLDKLNDLICQIQDSINSFLKIEKSTFLGVMSDKQASEVMSLLECPTKSEIEPYAVTLPEILEPHELENTINQLKESIQNMNEIDVHLTELLHVLRDNLNLIISKEEANIEKHISQLDRRIQLLHQKVANLESEEGEVDVLKARRRALKRDEKRRMEILSAYKEKSRLILEGNKAITKGIERIRKMLMEQQKLTKNILVPIGSTNVSLPWTILLTPFIVIGLSKKGKLEVIVYPPSKLNEVETRVGIRRDFIDVLDDASEYLTVIAAQISERANSDINMRKHLRESSEQNNLLSLKESRALLRDGIKALQADGFAKESQLSVLDSILSSFTEQSISTQESITIKPVSVQVLEGQSHVMFHIYDNQNHPIDDAKIDLGGMIFQTDVHGSVEVNLTKSSYEAVVSADGYKKRTIEFKLETSDDVVIPVILNPLLPEERLALELDALLERAKRLDIIRDRLWETFQKQGETLLSIPAYRGILVELLAELGYEPESWITEAQNKRGMVKRLLKRDDRENALRRDILRLAEESKNSGGLMLFSELLLQLDKLGWATDFDEIEDILKEMTREGLLEGITPLENGTRIVKFIPVALTDDPQKILNLAAGNAGKLTIEEAVLSLKWTEERVMNAMDLLVEKGVAKLQKTYSKSTIYWFPGLQEKVSSKK